MPYTQTPVLRTIDRGDGKTNNIVSLAYDFSTDPPVFVTAIPGHNPIQGTSFLIDLTSLGGARVIPATRSMQFTATFNAIEASFMDGCLYFYNPTTAEFSQFGFSQPMPDVTTGDVLGNGVVTAVIPLVCTSPTKILVVKAAGREAPPASVKMTGNVFINLYDFDRQPYVASSYYSTFALA
jgi:hypothetical protein